MVVPGIEHPQTPGLSIQIVEFLETLSEDGHRVLGLLTRSSDEKFVIIHIHGFGGDCFANSLVRARARLSKTLSGKSFRASDRRLMGFE